VFLAGWANFAGRSPKCKVAGTIAPRQLKHFAEVLKQLKGNIMLFVAYIHFVVGCRVLVFDLDLFEYWDDGMAR
jgi:hypothetical protein